MENQSEMDIIVESMMNHVCDDICIFPKESKSEAELEVICAECQMGKHICNILNTYNGLADRKQTDQDANWKKNIVDRFMRVN